MMRAFTFKLGLLLFVLLYTTSALEAQDCWGAGADGVSDFTVTPLPVNNNFNFGQTVNVCYTPNTWSSVNADWIHGVFFEMGCGWDANSITNITISPIQCTSAGSWAWYDANQLISPTPFNPYPPATTGCFSPSTFAGGFYFSNTGVTGWGDSGAGYNCPTFCFDVTTIQPAQFTGCIDLGISIVQTSDSETGSWSTPGNGCNCSSAGALTGPQDPATGLVPTLLPCAVPPGPQIDGDNLICSQDVETYCILNADPNTTYEWFDAALNFIGSGDCVTVNFSNFVAGDLTIQYINADCASMGIPFFSTTYPISALPAPNVSVLDSLPIALCPGETMDITGFAELGGPPDIPVTFTGNGGSIPDNTGASFISCVDVSGVSMSAINGTGAPIESVCLNVDHNNLSDLEINLISPAGSQIVLMNGLCGTGNDLDNVCFSPSATFPITSGCNQLANNTFAPQFPFILFNGSPTNTTAGNQWCIEIIDDQSNNPGTVLDWQITFQTTYGLDNSSIGWSTADGTITGANNQFDTQIDGPGTYTLQITDDLDCTGYYDLVVNSGTGVAVSLTDYDNVCEGSADFTITASQGNGNFSISPSGIIDAVTGVVDVSSLSATVSDYIVTYEIFNASCSSTATEIFTVVPQPTVSIVGLQDTYCNAEDTIVLAGSPLNGTFTVGATNSPIIVPANYSNQTSLDVTYEVTDNNGCTGSQTQVVDINPSEQADFNFGATNPQTICETDGLIFINYNPGTTFGGVFTGPNGLVIDYIFTNPGYPPNFTAFDVYAVNVAASIPGTNYTVTYTTPDPVCGDVHQETFTLNSLEYADYDFPPNICTAEDSVQFTPGPLFTPSGDWLATDLSGNPTTDIAFNDSSGTIIPSASIAGTYVISYQTIGPSTVCRDFSSDTVVISGLEVADFSINPSACGGMVSPQLGPQTTIGGTYNSQTPGLVFDPTTGEIDADATPQGNYEITYTTSTSSCANSETQTITILPPENADFSITNVCADATTNPFPIPSANIASGSWSINQGANIVSTSGEIILSSLTPGATYDVTYTTSGACQNTQTQSFTVNAATPPTLTGLQPEYCEGSGIINIPATPAGGQLIVNNVAQANLNIDNFSAGDNVLVEYTYTDANSCVGSIAQNVAITALPNLNFTLDLQYCETAGNIDLTTTAAPNGGTFDIVNGASGVTALDVSNYNPGDQVTVNYSYSDPITSCSNTTSATTSIVASPPVTFTLDDNYCEDAPIVPLLGSPVGGEFTVAGNLVSSFDPTLYVGQTVDVVYTYDDNAGCISNVTNIVAVNALPQPQLTNNLAYCQDFGTVNLTSNFASADFTVGINVGVTSFETTDYAAGDVVDVIVNYTDANGCSNSVSNQIEINGVASLAFANVDAAYCVTSQAVTMQATPAGGPFTIDAGAGPIAATILDPSQYTAGTNIDVCYSFTDPVTSCSNQICQVVSIDFAPQIQTGLDSDYCENTGTIQLIGNPPGGEFIDLTNNPGTIISQLDVSSLGGQTIDLQYSWDDGFGCSNTVVENIQINALPSISITNNATYCSDDGLIDLTSNQVGTNFLIDNVPEINFNTNNYSPPFTLNVDAIYEDANGCENTDQLSIEITALPSVDIAGLNNSYCLTSAPVTLTSNFSNVEFELASNLGTNITTIDPSQYTSGATLDVIATAQDANGCINTFTQQVQIDDAPSLSTNLVQQYCEGDAVVVLQGNQATGIFEDANGVITDFDPAIPGSYDIVYSYDDGNGCFASITESVLVNANPTGNFTMGTEYCANHPIVDLTTSLPSTGSEFFVGGNPINPPQIDPAAYPTGANLTVDFTYTDANSCSTSFSTPLDIFPIPQPTFGNLATQYCDGAAAFDPLPNIAGGLLYIDGVLEPSGMFDPSAFPLGSNVMVEYIVSQNNCQGTVSQSVAIANSLTASINGLPNSICVADAAITLNGSPSGTGGTWSGTGVTGNSFDPNGLTPGQSYTITYDYVDASGCTAQTTADIVIDDLDDATFSFAQTSYCVNAGNQSPSNIVTPGGYFTASGGLSIDPLSGQIDPSSGQIGQSYTITYNTGSNCSSNSTVTIDITDLDDASFNYASTSFCFAASNPLPTFVGTTGGTYSSADVTVDPSTGLVDLSNAQVGDAYTITYTTAGACANSESITIDVQDAPDASFSINTTDICPSDALPVVSAPSTPGGIFSIDGGLSVNPINGAISSQGLIPGNSYTVTYTTLGVCPSNTSQTFNVADIPELEIIGDEGICTGTEAVVQLSLASGSIDFAQSPPTWDFGEAQVISGANTGPYTLMWDEPGIYEITANVAGLACPVELASSNVLVQDLAVQTIEDVSIFAGEQIQLNTSASAPDVLYYWTPPLSLSCEDCPSPLAQPNEDIEYVVTAIDMETGCEVSDNVRVEVEIPEPFVPNIFTPNGDGINDDFTLFGQGITAQNMVVYTRWGERVFESNQVGAIWDGSFNGEILNPNVFIYVINYTKSNGDEGFLKGNVTLVK